MNEATVVIDDDDDVMLEPAVVNDAEDKDTGQKQNSSTAVDTIILDEDSLPAPTNHEAVTNNDRNSSFGRLLKNSTLINKIVKRCLRLQNNAGMSRVINKTLLPLYADADNKFKESEQFSALLKKIMSNLKRDPDHKFLHIKSLCEELKAGKFKRKVAFITLTTNLKKPDSFVPAPANNTKFKLKDVKKLFYDAISTIDSNKWQKCCEHVLSEEKNVGLRLYFAVADMQDIKRCTRYNLRKRTDKFAKYKLKRKARNINKNTDIINLDNSDDEPVINLDVDDDDDAIVFENVDTIVANNDEGSQDTILTKDDDVMIVDESTNSDVASNLSNKENKIKESENNKTPTSNCEVLDPTDKTTSNCKALFNNIGNKINKYSSKDLVSKDNNKILNNYKNELFVSNNINNTADTSNLELLVPKKSVRADQYSCVVNRAMAIEKQILIYKNKIAELEQAEVTNNYESSPYVVCDKYKARIVELYKKLCKITGHGDVNLMKQRVVRLQVIDGHPPGPTRRLEGFLNSTVDETGHVPLPDFHDVVRCVTEAENADRLGWKKEEIMREAITLFTQCGHALRKSRQRREYKDLLNLVREVKQEDPDDYDPANDDPHLHAKLEENKLIAKANEEEIMNRFVIMEQLPKTAQTLTPRLGNILRINPAEDSDTEDSDSELDLTPPKMSTTSVKQNNYSENKTHDSSKEKEEIMNNPVVNETTNTIHTRKQTGTGPSLENFVNISNTQDAIDCIVQNAFKAMPKREKITSSQTKLNITIQEKRTIITIVPNPTNITTENQICTSAKNTSNTTTQNTLNVTASNPRNSTVLYPNPTNTTTQNTSNVTASNPRNSTVLYPNPTNTTTQNTLETPTSNPRNTTILYPTNTTTPNTINTTTQNTSNITTSNRRNTTTTYPTNTTTQDTLNTTTGNRANTTILYPTNTTISNVTNTINNTKQNTTNHNLIKKPETDARTPLSSSNMVQKVGTSNRYIAAFDSSTSQANAKETIDDHNVTKENLNTPDTKKVLTDVRVKTEDTTIKQEPEDINDHNVTEENLNTPTKEVLTDVKVKTEDTTIKQEPEDINALLNALGDNFITTIFDIEDPFLVIEISSDSSSDEE